MSLKEQVIAKATQLAGELGERQSALLEVLCDLAVTTLTQRLRDGIEPEDCGGTFVTAASLYVLAALGEADFQSVEEFKAGDLTVKNVSGESASRCLQSQADRIIAPYLKDCFCFTGV